ncbi:uncharacterized protein LOC110974753 [Acanthaster planci]|uniref:Uncharacterized protein LOC110974753 n=1 Tax=Acanthaster planci TaxID=133434 RepID=A0A8B7XQK3_ACAPL|nr:uncharacterized protein LOC110974753 [Acanthaster planci]XP_022082286.1 uncharacterized protein LOC110974753 [Acanthaster planci]XP_022082287.1 uncharacterized protein LOC110974753 [Acanthaster planci]XP_022082288.1 uncharacterized protein LOC110974753 [Acanthaster planci]XP_022082289.1 uncharacterized protein LOC110974753 [Acanthaster planci]
MNKLGKHSNLPVILQRPSLLLSHSSASANSHGNDASTHESTSARNTDLGSHLQAVSLFTEVNCNNLQVTSKSETTEQCSTPKKTVKSNSAFSPTWEPEHSSATAEEFKENSLPTSTVPSVDHRSNQIPLYALETTKSCNGSEGLTPSIPTAYLSVSTPNFDADADLSNVAMPVQPVHINIQSVPMYQIVRQRHANVLKSTLTSTVQTNSLSENLPVFEISPLHCSSASEPDSDTLSPQIARNQFSETSSSTLQSPLTVVRKKLPKKAKTKSQQYQCPKCLCRFDRILAQLQHNCHPERTSGGSLRKLPSLKLYKCLECLEEFTNLESKIRHMCSSQKVTEPKRSSSEMKTFKGEKPVTEATGKLRKQGSQKHHQTISSTTASDIHSPEVKTNSKHHRTKHILSKDRGKTRKNLPQTEKEEGKPWGRATAKQFKCGLCSIKYHRVGYLKKHIASHIGSDEYKRSKMPFVCRLCRARFKTSKALISHSAATCHPKKNNAAQRSNNQSPELIGHSFNRDGPVKVLNNTASKSTMCIKDPTASEPRSAGCNFQQRSFQSDKPRSSKNQHKCGFCSLLCDSATALLKHVRGHWNEIFEKPSEPMICSRCNEEFDECVKLFLHVRRNGCTTASDDTSQSDEGEQREEFKTQAAVDRPEGNRNDGQEARASHSHTPEKLRCPHCSLTFWRSEILDVHMQSSHPLLVDETELSLGAAEKFPGINHKVVVKSTQSQNSIVHTVSSDSSISCGDSSDSEHDMDNSMRTSAFRCRCNICKLDFSQWNLLDNHRRTHHPQKVKHLKFGVDQQGGPDEYLDEPPVDIMKDDFFNPCDLCSRVFRHWRSLALHKKAKHQVKSMFARFSAPKKQQNQVIENLPSSHLSTQLHSSTDKNSCVVSEVVELETPGYQHTELQTGDSTEQFSDLSTDVNSLMEQHSLPSSPSDVSPLISVPNINSENKAVDCLSCDNQKILYVELSARLETLSDENISQRHTSPPLSVPKLTVEDLKISSVVSLHTGDFNSKNKALQGSDAQDFSIHSHSSEEKMNRQPMSKEMSCSVDAETSQNAADFLETAPDAKSFQASPTDQGQNTQDAFNILIDSVLALESYGQTNNFTIESIPGSDSVATSNELSNGERGWHHSMKKITFAEAKKMLQVLKKNPVSGCYHCSVCGKWFEHIPLYTSHILAHCQLEKFYCSFCGLTCLNVFAVLHHIIDTHSLTCEPNELTTSPSQSPLIEMVKTDKPASGPKPEMLTSSEGPPSDFSCSSNLQPGTKFPRPLEDYMYQPSRFERNLNCNAETGSYECPLCVFVTKEKSGLIYHLRVHHKKHPYWCRHCRERFSFGVDVQVHFFRCHGDVMEANQQQVHQQLRQTQDSAVRNSLPVMKKFDSSYRTLVSADVDNEHGVLSELTDSASFQSSFEATGLKTASMTTVPPCCPDTGPEQMHGSSSTSNKGDIPQSKLESLLRKTLENPHNSIEVEERLHDDEAKSINCIKDNASVHIKAEPECLKGEVIVKTEALDERNYQNPEWVDQAYCGFDGLQDETVDNLDARDNQPGFEMGTNKVPFVRNAACNQLPDKTHPCSPTYGHTTREMFDKGCFVEGNDKYSELNTTRKENRYLCMSSSDIEVPDLEVGKGCSEKRSHHEDVEVRNETSKPNSPLAELEVQTCSAKPIAETQNADGLEKVVPAGPQSVCKDVREVSGKNSVGESVDDVEGVRLASKSPVAEADPTNPGQPLDDLFQLASDIGIIVTESKLPDCSVNEKCAAQGSSPEPVRDNALQVTKEGKMNLNVVSPTDQDSDNAGSADMILHGDGKVSFRNVSFSDSDSAVLKEDAHPVRNSSKQIFKDNQDEIIEPSVFIQRVLESQTSPNLKRKGILENGTETQDNLKKQKHETTEMEKIVSSPSNISSVEQIAISDGCRESGSSGLQNVEQLDDPNSPHPEEEQVLDDLSNDADIGEDKIMSETLKEMAKNSFTSRILKSFENDCMESVLPQSSLDPDRVTSPPFVAEDNTARTEMMESQDICHRKERHSDNFVNIEQVKDYYMSCMPKIFAVAGNGQMPGFPCGHQVDSSKASLIRPCQQERSIRATVAGDANSSISESSFCLEGSRESEKSDTSESRYPVGDASDSNCPRISSVPDAVEKRRQDSHLIDLLQSSPKCFDQSPCEASFQNPVHEDLFGQGDLDIPRRASLPHSMEEQLSPSTSQQPLYQMRNCAERIARRSYSCEDSLVNHCQKTDLALPQNVGQDFHCPAGNRRNSTDLGQGSRQFLPQETSIVPSPTNQTHFGWSQEQYQHGSNHTSRQSLMHKPKEFSLELSPHTIHYTPYAPPVAAGRQNEGVPDVNSRQFGDYNSQQELRSPNVNSSIVSQKQGQEVFSNQWHHNRRWQQHFNYHSANQNMIGYPKSNDSLNYQFMPHNFHVQAPTPSCSQTSHSQWMGRTFLNSDSHGNMTAPPRNPYSHLWQPLWRNQNSALSSRNSSSSGSSFRYQRLGQPVHPQMRENEDTRRMEGQYTANKSVQQSLFCSTQTRFPLSHSEKTTAHLPQIVSVSSLHPRYLNKTHSL